MKQYTCNGCGVTFEKCNELAEHIINAGDEAHSGKILVWAQKWQERKGQREMGRVALSKLEEDTEATKELADNVYQHIRLVELQRELDRVQQFVKVKATKEKKGRKK